MDLTLLSLSIEVFEFELCLCLCLSLLLSLSLSVQEQGTAIVHTISASPCVCAHDEAVSGILGASVCGVCELHWVLLEATSLGKMSLSIHLKWIEVRATGRKSFWTFGEGFFGTWTSIAVF